MTLPEITQNKAVIDLINLALCEDLNGEISTDNDVTTASLVPDDSMIKAIIVAREKCTVSGVNVAVAVFNTVETALQCSAQINDGEEADTGDTILIIEGHARSILTAERTALNFMQRMTGIATMTASFVNIVKQYDVQILDTRKTTPALRPFEKYAVLCGGGTNHRMGLYDRAMVKDNHRRLLRGEGEDPGLAKAVEITRSKYPGIPVEVEIETEEELLSVLDSPPEWILLDNMGPDKLKQFIAICDGRSKTEASGGITAENLEAIAATGVDAISLGCLTHSAPSADLSLEIE